MHKDDLHTDDHRVYSSHTFLSSDSTGLKSAKWRCDILLRDMSSQARSKETDLLPALASVVDGLVDEAVESHLTLRQIERQAEKREGLDPKRHPDIESCGRLAAGYFALAVDLQAAMGSLATLEGRETPITSFIHMHQATRLQLTALAAERGFTVDPSVLQAIPYIEPITPKKSSIFD